MPWVNGVRSVEERPMNTIYNIALIDTNIFVRNNSDFIGIRSTKLPSLFETLRLKEITLLQSDIIDQEVKKHISESTLVKESIKLKEIWNKNLRLLEHYNIKIEDPLLKADVEKDLFDAYSKEYTHSIHLDYPHVQDVMEDYFESRPPFSSTGDKKHEFPDAFVIRAVKDYLIVHPEDTLLIVSDDKDWKAAFENHSGVTFCDSFERALELLHNTDNRIPQSIISEMVKVNLQELAKFAESEFENQTYYIDEFGDDEEIDVDQMYGYDIDCSDDYIIPLRITSDAIGLQTSIKCLADGEGTVFDSERSYWDSEDHEWAYRAYSYIKFKKAMIESPCEIGISYNIDGLGNLDDLMNMDEESRLKVIKANSRVDDFRLTNYGNLKLELDYRSTESLQLDEDDLANMALREDKGYPRAT